MAVRCCYHSYQFRSLWQFRSPGGVGGRTCVRISLATSGTMNSMMRWPRSMPRMRYAPWGHSRTAKGGAGKTASGRRGRQGGRWGEGRGSGVPGRPCLGVVAEGHVLAEGEDGGGVEGLRDVDARGVHLLGRGKEGGEDQVPQLATRAGDNVDVCTESSNFCSFFFLGPDNPPPKSSTSQTRGCSKKSILKTSLCRVETAVVSEMRPWGMRITGCPCSMWGTGTFLNKKNTCGILQSSFISPPIKSTRGTTAPGHKM